ncbi:hypothetical protein EV702DRAFT_593886 [Suillus placidus]|uniref:Uncharacterized protein n=1 Tax=Suillus placidus TaxID=48579 RepID=A0A9P7A332_9AGAM|nr:hypothetical protein EV702DRAFT_593886 [Suillus placidus]
MNNATPRQALKENQLHATPTTSLSTSEGHFFQPKKMQRSTTSPFAAVHSTVDDFIASQRHNIHKTPARAHRLQYCGRAGCTAVFVYVDGTDWPTVNRLVNDHYLVCTGHFYGLAASHPPSDTHGLQHAPSSPQLAPESWGVNNGNRDNDEVIAGPSNQRQNEDERIETLENDGYTDDVQPTSVRCRGCNNVICLDKRFRYYPGLWNKHRGKCRGILKLENDKLTSGRDWVGSSDPESRPPAARSIGASGEYSEEEDSEGDEDEVMGFSTSDVRLHNAC